MYERIVITGGGGMLAHALMQAIRARGMHVVPLGHTACDITDPGQMRRVFDELRPTLLLNCAAYTKVDQAEQEPDLADAVNGQAVGNLARWCRDAGVVIVHYSTDFVFDGTSGRPYRTDDPTNPLSAYGRSKLRGERALQAASPARWLIIRTSWLYGPGGNCFPRSILRVARQGQPLNVVDDQIGSPTFTFDLAEATLELLDRGAGGIWHLANTGQTSWFGFAQAILDQFGVSTALNRINSDEWKRQRPQSATRPRYSVLDSGPFSRLVGRPMRAWQEALRDYARTG